MKTKRILFLIFSMLIVASMVLSACVPAATEEPVEELVQAVVQAEKSPDVTPCPSSACDASLTLSGRRGRWFKSSRPDLTGRKALPREFGRAFSLCSKELRLRAKSSNR